MVRFVRVAWNWTRVKCLVENRFTSTCNCVEMCTRACTWDRTRVYIFLFFCAVESWPAGGPDHGINLSDVVRTIKTYNRAIK